MRIPLSFRDRNRNCSQEPGSTSTCFAVTIYPMASQLSPSPLPSKRISFTGWLLLLTLLLLEWLAGRASGRAAVVVAPHITLVVFSDRPLPDDQWTNLAATLRLSFDDLALETHFAAGGFEVVRGDHIAPGMRFEEVISLYLHGDCHVEPRSARNPTQGALGWVIRDLGQIRPSIHIDCTRIPEVVRPRTSGMDMFRRETVKASTISRVILHEWLHIAIEIPVHSREEISKCWFGLHLVPDYPQILARLWRSGLFNAM